MSLFGLFNIGKSAIFATQRALNVTSHNIANVNTSGYSRQEVILQLSNPVTGSGGFIGTGVTAAGIRRHYDRFIQMQLLGQQQNFGKSMSMNESLGQVEQIFNESKNLGISGSLTEFFNAWNDVASNAEGQAERMILLQKAEALVLSAKHMEQGILNTVRNINEEIRDITARVNNIASNIASLNEKIVHAEAGHVSGNAADFRDQRDAMLAELSEFMNVSTFESSSGSITVIAGGRVLVHDNKTTNIIVSSNQGNNDIYMDGVNISGLINKGRVGGLFAAREHIQSTALTGLRTLVMSVIDRVNTVHETGYGLDGSTGNYFFNPVADLSSAISNFSVVISDPKKIAASSSGTGLPADNAMAVNIAQLFDADMAELGDTTFMDYYRGIVFSMGTMSRAATDSLKFDSNLLLEINNRREAVSGVSLDEEAANLIRFQRSFEAGARMIKVTDELFQTILNL